MGPLIDLSLYGGGRQAISFQHTLADQLAHFLADASPTEAFHAVEHAVRDCNTFPSLPKRVVENSLHGPPWPCSWSAES